MRTALRRARRLGAFLLITLAAGWVVLRRRSPVRWIEPAPGSAAGLAGAGSAAPEAEIGAPGEVPADVLATDAGLTELPAEEAVPAPSGTVAVDEVLVGELLADAPADRDVDEAAFEQALVDATPARSERPPAPTDAAPDQADAAPALEPSDAAPVGDAEAAGAVAEVVAAEPVEAVVADESDVAALADDEPTDTGLTAPELGIDEPTMTIARDAIAADSEETGTRIPMPTFSEAPTMEIPAVTDDLRAVRGIGPSMERLLHGLGIISFRQLAMLDGVELERVRAELSDFRTRIEREDWVGQARDLHKEKYGRDPS